ncbi:MAG: hypothetical protein A2Y34_12420 [Spirochaetes bacterium GWC1_27_15]|nr:MAG: hypothetical protein A2Y34_12420 [Spirochaetes bacterium GWC1_27_15]
MKQIIFLFLVFVLFSCKTMDEIIIEKIDDQSLKQIETIEILFLKYKTEKNRIYIDNSKKLIEELSNKAKNNKFFKAKIFGLEGEIALLQNNISEVNSMIQEIEVLNPNEEKLFILKASIEENLDKKESIIKQGIEKATTNTKLKLNLADLIFIKGDFTQATALYDEVFNELGEDYKSYYKKRRDLSYQFINNPPENIKIINELNKEKISFGDIIKITSNETAYLTKILNKSSKIEDNFQKLKEYGFFYKDNSTDNKIDSIIKRKDIAYFLLNIVSFIQNNKTLLTKYKIETKNKPEEKDLSPVPDIKTYDYFYTAVLILVEQEILDLPDGVNFLPENTMTGLEFFKLLKIFKKNYKN